MRLFWVGGVLENNEFEEELRNGNAQIAANKMQLSYIEGLEKNTGEVFTIINSNFEPSYPKYKKLFVKKREWKRKGQTNINIGFINIPILKYIIKTKKIKNEIGAIDFFNKDQNIVFLYSMTLPIISVAKYLKKKCNNGANIKTCLIVPDLPEYMNMTKRGLIRQFLEAINNQLLYRKIKYVDYFVLLTDKMAEHLRIHKDYVVVEGLAGDEEKSIDANIAGKKYIMYAGGVNKKYGVAKLAEAFHNLDNNEYELWIYGSGDAVETIQELVRCDNRIKYKGIANNDEVLEAERQATLLLNPRPTGETYTQYSFPSKIIEYMSSGTPVLTTKLGGIPVEYYEHLYFFDNEETRGMTETLRKIIDIDKKELDKKGLRAKEFIYRNKNNIAQTRKVLKLITNE